MEINKSDLESIIKEHYEAFHPEFVVTPRILEKLVLLFDDGLKKTSELSLEQVKQSICSYLEKDNVIMFVSDRQPVDLNIPEVVKSSVNAYFEESLKNYDVIAIFRASNAKSDSHLFSVIAKKKEPSRYFTGNYACWSSWNQSKETLNYGHYDIETLDSAMSILNEMFYDISDNKEFGPMKLPFYYNEELVDFKNDKLVETIKKESVVEPTQNAIVDFRKHTRR